MANIVKVSLTQAALIAHGARTVGDRCGVYPVHWNCHQNSSRHHTHLKAQPGCASVDEECVPLNTHRKHIPTKHVHFPTARGAYKELNEVLSASINQPGFYTNIYISPVLLHREAINITPMQHTLGPCRHTASSTMSHPQAAPHSRVFFTC